MNQIEFYQWLFRKNGFQVVRTGYFVFANASKEHESFGDRLNFEKILLPCAGDDSWVEPTLDRIKTCLDQNEIPAFSNDCSFCQYNQAISMVS